MHISEEFSQQLHDAFDGRFRVRWSNRRDAYQVEYKVQPGQVLEPPRYENGDFDTHNDDFIRARDGYDFLVEVRRGDRMPCPDCGLTIHLQPLVMQEAVCEHCKVRGRDGRVNSVFYPLNHVLIEHLRFIDPLSGGGLRIKQLMRDRAAAKETSEWRHAASEMDAAGLDVYNRLVGIGTWGYTKSPMAGSEGPGTK